MADVLYPKFKEALLTAGIDVENEDMRVCLLRDSYIYNAAHEFMSDITAGNENGRSAALGSKTITSGVFDAADTSATATAAAATNAIAVFKHTGVDATAKLLAYIDFSPFTPSAGMSVVIQFNASGIFAL